MYKKIKNNPLYNFIFRLIIIFVLSSLVWVFLIRSYYEEQISNNIQIEINTHKEKIVELLSSKPKDIEKELKTIENSKFIEFLLFYDSNKNIIMEYEKGDSLKRLTSLIKDFGDLNFNTAHQLFHTSKEKGYLYSQSTVMIDKKNIHYKLLVSLDQNTLAKIREDIGDTIFIVIITIIIVFFSIFPLVYSQYKSMLKKQKELIQSNINTLISLGNAIAKRDSDTSEHNYRVTYYSLKIAEEMSLDKKTIRTIIKGAFLHDIGKIAISDNILLKPEKLNDEEFNIMKTHVTQGIDIVKNDPWLKDASKVILNHHEKVDGNGYPNGLKNEDIPIEARIFAVADVFDALTSKRPYKEAFSVEKSMGILHNDAGDHFDPQIVKYFDKIHKDIHNEISNISNSELEKLFMESLKPYFY